MINRVSTLSKLDSTASVWRFLKSAGGIDVKYYDSGLEAQVILELGADPTRSLNSQINNFDIETFLSAFFRAVEPFSQMMTDLIKLFESNFITSTNNNVHIKFDFGNKKHSFNFDISKFKTWQETTKSIVRQIFRYEITAVQLQKIREIFSRANGYNYIEDDAIRDDRIRSWLNTYSSGNLRSLGPIPGIMTNRGGMEKTLDTIFGILSSYVQDLQEIAESRHELYLNTKVPDHLKWEVDLWVGQTLKQIVFFIESMDIHNSNHLVKMDIEGVLLGIKQTQLDTVTLKKEIEELLQLPVWKHRYELYSTWILTQICMAFDTEYLRFHDEDGALVFSFSGSHLATVNNYKPKLKLWTELRTPLKSPTSKKRKKAIQPDYTVGVESLKDPDSSLVVIECKQYKRPSKKNFKEALIDYATGRPKAQVVLVNYGPVNPLILTEIDPTLGNRTHIIGNFLPGATNAQQELKRIIKLATDHLKQRPINISSVSLSWGPQPVDLDLKCIVEENRNRYVLDYGCPGTIDGYPWANYEQDVRTGYGPEVIEFAKTIPSAVYTFYVHNYSGETALNTSNAVITIVSDSMTKTITCPSTGLGQHWLVFKLSDRGIEELNTICDDF